ARAAADPRAVPLARPRAAANPAASAGMVSAAASTAGSSADSMSGPAAMGKLVGSVHGVVVHARAPTPLSALAISWLAPPGGISAGSAGNPLIVNCTVTD